MSANKPLKVLLVDDDETQLMILTRWLQHDGYQVAVRSTAFGTASAVLRERPDIVMLDLMMPGLSGDALAKVLGDLPRSKPMGIVFYSGSDPESLDELSQRAPVLGAIRKTTDSDLFRQMFRRMVLRFLRMRLEVSGC